MHCIRVANELTELLAGLDIPQLRRFVEATPEDVPAVRRVGHAMEAIGMATQDPQLCARLGIPQPRSCVWIRAARNHIAPIRRECNAKHARRVAGELA